MLISAIMTLVTIFKEYKYGPLYPLKSDIMSNIKLNWWRYSHWNIVLFVSFFFAFFNVRALNKDIVIYYSVLLIIVIHWYSNVCVISLLETKHYDINPKELPTTNIPYLQALFGSFGRNVVANIFYLSTICNFIYITLFTKKINKMLKYSVFLIVLVAFYHSKTKNHKNYTNGFLYDNVMENNFI